MPRFLQEIASLTNGFLREMVYNLLGRLFLGRDVAKAILETHFHQPFHIRHGSVAIKFEPAGMWHVMFSSIAANRQFVDVTRS